MSAELPRPLVSVVVPTYNNAAFVRDTMRSILSQTFADFELIVSDHSSTDGTWELLHPFASDPRVHLLQMPRTDHPHDNWDNATRAATGRYLKLVCGDDLLAPECLERQVAAMQSHPRAVMVASRRDVVTARGDMVLRSWGLPRMLGELSGRAAVRQAVQSGTNTFGEPACVLLCRSSLEAVGGWDGTHSYVLDQHTYSKVLMRGTFVGLEEPLASFRLSDSQWSHALARNQYRQVVAFHRDLAASCPDLLSRTDLARGRAKAKALAYARRLAYFSLARELRTPVAPIELQVSPQPASVPVAGLGAE